MLEGIEKRVALWNAVGPFYTDAEMGPDKTIQSRGTESVLNALILTSYDARTGKLNPITKTALENMWSLQLTSGEARGAWNWLNFKNGPWEADESQYWGAVLGAIAVGNAPEDYRSDPRIQQKLGFLQAYLRQQYAKQPIVNRINLLWASAELPGLLDTGEREELISTIFSLQQPDGGWSLPSFGTWKRQDNSPLDTRSDGFATGLTLLALLQAGIDRSQPRMKKGFAWLEQNQDPNTGLWPSYSLNKQRDPNSNIGRFMSDAATGYSVMALER